MIHFMSKYWNSDNYVISPKNSFPRDERNWKLFSETLFRVLFIFYFLLPMTGIFQADNNLTISNFEEVLAASCELKDIRFQMMARRSNSYCYCFSSMCKCIKLSCIQHYLLIFASYLIFKINPNYNILPIWKYFGLYLWQGKKKNFQNLFANNGLNERHSNN